MSITQFEASWASIASSLATESRVNFEPMWGNHGDTLILKGALKFLKDAGKVITSAPSREHVLVVNGGGAMAQPWGGLQLLQKYLEQDFKKIVVLPSSFYGDEELFKVHQLAKAKKVDLTLFARDKESQKRVERIFCDTARIIVSHDMAFYLTKADLNLSNATTRAPYVLIVERRDAELSTGVTTARAWRVPFKGAIPAAAKRSVKRMLERRDASGSSFASWCLQIAKEDGYSVENFVYGDVSDGLKYSYDDFLRLVLDAEVVFTTRLHVAILRDIFGKPCYLHSTGGEYKKNESVYDHSLRLRRNVKLLQQQGNGGSVV
jgi:exopolysaccharide biosynthesis predicted pyruvyltransferase EpsI